MVILVLNTEKTGLEIVVQVEVVAPQHVVARDPRAVQPRRHLAEKWEGGQSLVMFYKTGGREIP